MKSRAAKKGSEKSKIGKKIEIDMSETVKGRHASAVRKSKQAVSEHDQEPLVLDMVGGQAVTEGVLMRDQKRYAIAVRTPKGIKLKSGKLNLITEKHRILRLPIIRGTIAFFDAMIMGMSALVWSSNQALGEDEQLSKKDMLFVILGAIVMSLGLFFALPFIFTRFVSNTDKGIWFNLLEGLVRISILVLYIWLISRMKEIKTLFQYHGSEHKTVHCYEAGEKLTVENVRKHSRLHPRCGTSYLIIIALVSVLVFSLILKGEWYVKLGLRLLFIPLIMGLSYELLRFSARHCNNIIVRIFIAPGLLMQRLTTREPTDRQIEVAIRSLSALANSKEKKSR